MFAFGLADAAASLRMPVENPNENSVKLRDDDGSVMTIRLTDRPMNRAGMAVAQHFKGHKFRAIMARLLALHDVYKNRKLASWVRTAPDGRQEIAESLLAAAAQAPLTTRLKFRVGDMARLATKYEQDNDLVDALPDK